MKLPPGLLRIEAGAEWALATPSGERIYRIERA